MTRNDAMNQRPAAFPIASSTRIAKAAPPVSSPAHSLSAGPPKPMTAVTESIAMRLVNRIAVRTAASTPARSPWPNACETSGTKDESTALCTPDMTASADAATP